MRDPIGISQWNKHPTVHCRTFAVFDSTSVSDDISACRTMRLGYICKLVFLVLLRSSSNVSAEDSQNVLSGDDVSDAGAVTFLSQWSVLGPFRIGTRGMGLLDPSQTSVSLTVRTEAIWGADPLEFYGGINHVDVEGEVGYHSPLTRNATVHWSSRTFSTRAANSGTSIDLTADFPDVDWVFAQRIYGWSALQYQGWLKGHIVNAESVKCRVVVYPDNILEFWINDYHVFGGDFYAFQRAPVVLDLQPGLNNVSIRFVRDVRSMGGALPPDIQARLRVEIAPSPVKIVQDSVVLPDVVNERFCSQYGSLLVRNQGSTWIEVRQITAYSNGHHFTVADDETTFAPGQSRPMKLDFKSAQTMGATMKFDLEYTDNASEFHISTTELELRRTEPSSLQQITFLHLSGAVSYATLRPPPAASSSCTSRKAPVLLNLHGAGVEVDDTFARHMFDDTPDLAAWILSPTGMTSWSGDDWHTWGLADAHAAVSAIAEWIEWTAWKGPGVFTEKLLVAGHSNGGQGTWYLVSHQPDRVLGAAAASGYSSIENYVPYVFWNEADALQSGILQISRNNYRHELLAENLVGIPVFQQHGSADDNVPTYHSRLMNTLLAQAGKLANYAEILDQGHWFTGTMTTEPMVEFYLTCLNVSDPLPEVLPDFAFTAPNSHDLGSRYGLFIDQLTTPDRMGHVKVSVSRNNSLTQWHLRTQNIRRLHLDSVAFSSNPPYEIFLDDLPYAFDVQNQTISDSFVLTDSNIWAREVAVDWRNLEQRYGRQRGVLDSILRTAGAFQIVHCSDDTLSMAVQVSRNLLQYFGADSSIVPEPMYRAALEGVGNVITIGLGNSIPPAQLATFPIRLQDGKVLLTTRESGTKSIPLASGMGGIWLRPLPSERLELVIWGFDEVGLQQAARLVPTLTGGGQPDFVIFSDEARWKGHAGAQAMGFFDYNWRISSASYLP